MNVMPIIYERPYYSLHVTLISMKSSVAAFGFCEYKEPESTLRALRLLHDLQIGDKNLLVKVDAKTKSQLDEWKAKKKTANGVWIHFVILTVYNFDHCIVYAHSC